MSKLRSTVRNVTTHTESQSNYFFIYISTDMLFTSGASFDVCTFILLFDEYLTTYV